jgi:hypothetical protein
VYRVSYEQVRDAGCDLLGVRAARLGLSHRGAPVPIHVAGGGAFGPGAFIELVGEAADSAYTRENVYRLTVEDAPARVAVDRRPPPGETAPVATVTATRPLGVRREYAFASPTADPWFDTRMLVTSAPGEWTFEFDLPGLAGDGAGTLTVDLFGGVALPVDPDHHVEVALSGRTVADIRFDGLAAHRAVIAVPAGGLKAAGNRMVLRLPADLGTPFDVVHLQGYAATYTRAIRARDDAADFTGAAARFDVPGFADRDVVAYRRTGAGLARLEGVRTRPDGAGGWIAEVPGDGGEARYLVAGPAAIAAPRVAAARSTGTLLAGPAQYLAIAHPDFIDGLAPLLAARRAQGLAVNAADVRDVYAAYSHGIVDPEAIRDYIADAARSRGTEYVLLVGGDTYDYHGYTGAGARSFIPSLYAATDEVVRFAPVDPAFADLDRDGVPDLAIGRLPVRTREELAAVVAKTLAYERAGGPRSAVLVADRSRPGEALWYLRVSEEAAARLGPGWRRERIYLDEMPPAAARELLLSGIRGGAALITFVGHSGPSSWSQDPVLSLADVGSLSNADRPTVAVQWACWNTYFVSPLSDSLGVAMLVSPCGGAAAVLGTTSLASDTAQRALANLLAGELAAPGAVRLGAAVLAAKRALARQRPGAVGVQLGWTLLGDPALMMPQ